MAILESCNIATIKTAFEAENNMAKGFQDFRIVFTIDGNKTWVCFLGDRVDWSAIMAFHPGFTLRAKE